MQTKKKKPLIKAGVPGKTYGLRWGLSIRETWEKLLSTNITRKFTDYTLKRFFQSEFPKRVYNHIRLPQVRYHYNHGVNGYRPGGKPLKWGSRNYSTGYDVTGARLDGAGGRPSQAELDELEKDYQERKHEFKEL